MSYLGKAPGAPGGVRQVYEFVATAGQTTFSGADRNGATLSYDPGFANVFVGGVMLSQADVTATNGSSIVLLSGVPAGKIVQIEAFGTFKVADALTIAGGAVNGYLTTPTAPRFDYTTKLATTAWVQGNGFQFRNVGGVGISADMTLSASQVGGWGQFQGVGKTLTLPSLASLVPGSTFTVQGAATGGTLKAATGEVIIAADMSSANTLTILPNETITVVSNGTAYGWFAVANGVGGRGFANSKTNNGYQKLPGGLIIQWGYATFNRASSTYTYADITFPITFPNAALDLYATLSGVNVKAYALLPIFVDSYNASTAAAGVNGVQPTGIQQVTWLAIGY